MRTFERKIIEGFFKDIWNYKIKTDMTFPANRIEKKCSLLWLRRTKRGPLLSFFQYFIVSLILNGKKYDEFSSLFFLIMQRQELYNSRRLPKTCH